MNILFVCLLASVSHCRTLSFSLSLSSRLSVSAEAQTNPPGPSETSGKNFRTKTGSSLVLLEKMFLHVSIKIQVSRPQEVWEYFAMENPILIEVSNDEKQAPEVKKMRKN